MSGFRFVGLFMGRPLLGVILSSGRCSDRGRAYKPGSEGSIVATTHRTDGRDRPPTRHVQN
jgi:hypothetical protein